MGALEEFDRKDAHLKRLLEHAKEDGRLSAADRNQAYATNEAMWEHGEFSDEKPENVDSAMIYRIRRDALEAKLNSIDILKTLEEPQEGYTDQIAFMTALLRDIRFGVYAIIVLLFFIIWKLS